MTQKIFSRKSNPVLNFLRFTLKKQTPYTLLITAFTLLVCPGTLLKSIAEKDSYYSSAWDMSSYFTVYTVVIFIASLVLMFLLLMVNFSFLFSKKSGDLYHSLPLTRNELLFSRAFAAYIGVIFNMTVAYAGLVIVNFLPGAIGVELAVIATTYLMMLLFTTLLVAFTLIFVVVSGGFFDFIIAAGVINAGIPGLYLVFANFFSSVADGLSTNFTGAIYTTPFAYTVYKLVMHIQNNAYTVGSTVGTEQFSVWSVVCVVVLTVLCVIICSKLFKIRKSETAGEAYSFKFVPNIISTILSAAGGYVIGYLITFNSFESFDFWMFFILGAVLCSVTFGAIATRGFKTVKVSALKAGIAIAVTLCLVISINIIGARTSVYVPKNDKIEKIELFYDSDVVFTDKFELITGMHAQILENLQNNYHDDAEKEPEIINNISELNVRYIMENGATVERIYGYHLICRDNLYDDMLAIMQTEEFFNRYNKIIYRNNKTVVIDAYGYKDFDERSGSLVKAEVVEDIIETYKKEMMAADLDIFTEKCLILNMSGQQGHEFEQLIVPESFNETIALIDGLLPLVEVEKDEAVVK